MIPSNDQNPLGSLLFLFHIIRKVKMRKGVELLMSGQYTISEIAYMIGFSSVAYFRQCFKDEYGMSPSDYVKQKQ